MSSQLHEVGMRHYKPKDLKWDAVKQTWTVKVSVLGHTTVWNGSDPERLCTMINTTIGQHMTAHNLAPKAKNA